MVPHARVRATMNIFQGNRNVELLSALASWLGKLKDADSQCARSLIASVAQLQEHMLGNVQTDDLIDIVLSITVPANHC